jgi:hypothetical protein
MSSGEKKIAVILVVVLVAMVGLYLSTSNKAQSAPPMGNPMMAKAAGGAGGGGQSGSAAGCAPSGQAGGAAKTEELGKKGAKLEVIAMVPVAHGCHAKSIAELKKAYQAHQNDIHLTVVDAWGPDAAKYQQQIGIKWTFIAINGKTTFELNGKKLTLEKAEGMTYTPADLVPLIESLLKKA